MDRAGLALASGALLLGLGLGYVAGGPSVPAAVPPAPAVPAPTRPPSVPSPAPSRPADLSEALAQCEGELAAATAILEAQQRATYGEPVPFDPDLPPAYQPAAFEANVEEAIQRCGVTAPLEYVECSEYPCIAVFAGDGARQALKDCDWWNARYPQQGVASANGSIRVGDDDVRYDSLGEWAEGFDGGDPDNTHKRMQLRFQDLRAELMGRWGGRELTEAETKARERAFWERLADDGNEGAIRMLEMMDEQDAR